MIDSRLQIAENQEDIAKAFEGVSEDLGYKVKVIYTDPSKSSQLIGTDKDGNTYIKDGTAYVDKKTGINYILINSESPANRTKAGVIGTIAEEQSHIIGKIEGRQKTVPDGSEKGLESLGRPTNNYFKNQYSKNDKAIGLKSDGRDYSNVDFGENVGDHISPEDLKFKKYYRDKVLPYNESYQNFLNNTLSIGLDVSPLGIAKGITEAILGYDTITGEKLDLVTRTMGIIPVFDDIYKTGRSGIKLLTPTREVEAVLVDGTRLTINVDDTIKGTNNTKKIISSTNTSIPKIEVETPKIKPVEDIIGTKTGNKELNNAINTRGAEYYLDLRAQKATAPINFNGHIINGEINAGGRAVGGHSMLGGNVRIDAYAAKNPISPNGVRNVVISVYDPSTGTWIQKVDRFGEPQLTTLFPENWSKSRIIVEVDIAYKNRIISQTRRNIWKGTTPSGIKVEGYIAPNTTVFPLQ
ncbi:EndoU domain-containing protein [Fusobacterium polymorphum]|uniref:EndoU domain-containing protein n=3 Tax=Fusobacteriaceae TaxID=203492 RepID=UPI0008A65A1E|nr:MULTISPECIES: EndoU domain-containing protein [Fusobacterium]QYR59204.1 EndoU domain-containing protein [Fusobacterium polymorphum]